MVSYPIEFYVLEISKYSMANNIGMFLCRVNNSFCIVLEMTGMITDNNIVIDFLHNKIYREVAGAFFFKPVS